MLPHRNRAGQSAVHSQQHEERVAEVSELVKRLRILAGMISMCEPVSWGSDSSAMNAAADEIERLHELLIANGIDPDVEQYVYGIRVSPPKQNGHGKNCQCVDCVLF